MNKTIFLIKTQQLVPDSLDGDCSVSSELVYNNMSKAMNKFNNDLFKNEHKSYYTHQDVRILDGYRTVVPLGLLQKVDAKIVEIDISKAFSHAFRIIKEIPIFNEFDEFSSYSDQSINDLSLYIVSVESNDLIFNKK